VNTSHPAEQNGTAAHTLRENAILDELADPSRRAILQLLRTGPMSVTDLVERTGLKQPNVSNHLAKMRSRGIVDATRSGRQIFYKLAHPMVESVLAAALDAVATVSPEIPGEDKVAAWSQQYYEALAVGDEERASRIVSDCLAQRLPMDDLFVDVLQTAMHKIGQDFAAERITVAQEHLATGITERMVARASQFYGGMRHVGRTAVLGAVAGNWHSVGLRMIADILTHYGWHAVYLGANVPTESFARMVSERQPDVVIISVALGDLADEARALVSALRSVREKRTRRWFAIGVGGGYVNARPEFAKEIGADFTASSVRGLMTAIEKALPD
jgi:methanogenic corrinoid protein MtbC1